MTAVELLAAVLRDARCLMGESPEQAAAALGVAGRTIRRLEAAKVARPRDLTLDALGQYYNLDAGTLKWLAACELAGRDLDERVREGAADAGVAGRGELPAVALAWVRAAAPPPVDDGSEAGEQSLLMDFRTLDRRRQAVLRALAADLRMARAAELRMQPRDESP
jgi:transcriptional regulator with XRE-family HTH domain